MGASSRRSRSRSPSKNNKEKERHHRDRSPSSKKHHHHHHHKSSRHDEDDDRRHKHRREETEEERKERKRLKRDNRKKADVGLEVVDDDDDGAVWVEKSIDGDEATSLIPTAKSLPLRSNASGPGGASPPTTASNTQARERDSWMLEPAIGSSATLLAPIRDIPHSAKVNATSRGMTDGYGDEEVSNRGLGGGMDFFSSMGTEHKRKDPNDNKPDPSKLVIDKRELNRQLVEGKSIDEYETIEKKATPGGPGYQWRMMKLNRLFEQAKEQGRDVEEVALERYGSLEDFNDAQEERRVVEERQAKRSQRRGQPGSDGTGGYATPGGGSSGMRTPDTGGGRRFMFANPAGADDSFGSGSRPNSRAGFRRPGEEREMNTPGAGRLDELKRHAGGTPLTGNRSGVGAAPKMSTPIPSVFTPTQLTRTGSGYPFTTPDTKSDTDPTSSKPPMSLEQLNKLQAKVIRAKLMDDADAGKLEEEYDRERARADQIGGEAGGMWEGSGEGLQGQLGRVDEQAQRIDVQVLPTLDGRGKLYDVGTGQQDDVDVRAGNKRKKVEKFETRDREGNIVRYNADDDEQTLGELVRQERFGAGSKDQKSIDGELAAAITSDARFDDDLEYMDDNAERLARHKRKTDALKRAFAINDYARTKKALDSCPFCYQDERPPQTAIVALGTRTYLSCTINEELVPGHCLIVPLQHHLSMLEMEDDDWDEVRNFMKCLMRMHAKTNHGVIFFETVLSFKHQKHTYIEAIPVPYNTFQDLPAYFRESIMSSEGEWTQHKKVIDFSSRPGGFRKMMVENIPYFMVQWDYKGEKGYGHVIEGVEESGAGGGTGEDAEGDVGGTSKEEQFPRYFAHEVIGNVLGLEPRKWRKLRKIDMGLNKDRARRLGEQFQPYNWTVGQGV